jgi:hypothetical protein
MLDHAATRAPITSGKIIVWGALGFLLYIAHATFIPIVLALIALVVAPENTPPNCRTASAGNGR